MFGAEIGRLDVELGDRVYIRDPESAFIHSSICVQPIDLEFGTASIARPVTQALNRDASLRAPLSQIPHAGNQSDQFNRIPPVKWQISNQFRGDRCFHRSFFSLNNLSLRLDRDLFRNRPNIQNR